MRIREVAEKAGISVETVRFYERANVLPAASRNAAGHRIFGPADQRMLVIIGWAQGLGLTLAEIAKFVIHTRELSVEQKRALLAEQVQVRKKIVKAEIARLKAVEQDLEVLEKTPLDQGVWLPAAFVDYLILRLGLTESVPSIDGRKVDPAYVPSSQVKLKTAAPKKLTKRRAV